MNGNNNNNNNYSNCKCSFASENGTELISFFVYCIRVRHTAHKKSFGT